MTDEALLRISGLNARELGLLRSALAQSGGIVRAWLFGSRAKGTAKTSSDIDIAVEGLPTNLQVEDLRDRLNDLPFPYAVDVQAVEGIKNAALRDHIVRCGVLLFENARLEPSSSDRTASLVGWGRA